MSNNYSTQGGRMESSTISIQKSTPPHTEEFEKNMRKAFLKLQHAREHGNTQWSFLPQYLDLGISPRGLRIKKQCHFLDPDL